MALTKVTGQVIKNTTDVTVGVLTVTNTLAVGGTVSIGGTLTYEDVTNVDAVGLVTARNGIVVGSGITLSKDGDGFFTGVTTATTFSGAFSGSGANITALNASNISSGTVPTARLGSGTASSSTFLRGDSSFQTITTDLVGDTSPQLGGDLASNGNDIKFADNDKAIFGTGTDLQIYHNGTNNYFLSSNGAYVFDTGSAELARLTTTGRLGIGDNSPDKPLHVKSADNVLAMFESTDADALIEFKDNSTSDTMIIGCEGGDNLLLRTDAGNIIFNLGNNSEKARFDSSGRLLIGTTTEGDSTADNLTIADSGACGITIRSGTTSEGNIFFSDGTSGAAEYAGTIQYNHSSNFMQFATNGSERMRIVSDGRVSIGGMAPDTGVALHIEKTSAEANFLLEGDTSTIGGYLMLKNKNNTANSSMSIQFLDASGQGVSEINGVAMSDANNQGYLAFKTRPNGGSMTERFKISDIGVQEYTQQSNVRTFNFAFSGGVGGSTTTQNIATLSNFAGSTNAVAHVYYVGTYGLANDYIYSGIWVCGTRRKNSNSGWNAQSTQTANGGSGSAGPVVIGWDAGVLQFTCTAFMGYTLHVSLTVYNATTTINAL